MSKMKLKRPKKTANDTNCEYRYDGYKHTADNKEECDKLKAEYQKYLKDNNLDNIKSRSTRNRTLTRGDDFQEKKKKDNAFRDSKNDGNVASRFFERLKERKKSKRERRNSLNPMD